MNHQEINKKIKQKLQDFESLEIISVSDNWDAQLNEKLFSNQSVKQKYVKKYTLILVCLVVLNISFITYTFIGTSERKENTTSNLRLVSNELLITLNN